MNLTLMGLKAEILCLGNELLIGRTINKNAADIALALTKIGFTVTRETTVRDDVNRASEALNEIIQRKPNCILITGGLGPTHDDIQLEVVAKSISTKLVINNKAVKMMEQRYNISNQNLNEYMIKMCTLPEGSNALNNSKGAAPGVEIYYHDNIIFCLPGVPKEMNAILHEEIIPRLIEHFQPKSKMIEFGFSLRGVGESTIVDLTNHVMNMYPDVGFKSHPKNDDTGYWMELHTYMVGSDENLVKNACQTWFEKLNDHFQVDLTPITHIFNSEFEPE
ncbi:MAG: NMN amidohydrolase-like protein YfaY [Candidatus Heimdallarchaeota archaeon LC_2]|nr:MAG: NMN amidohydrolase-like protein YfaY [Candidatus Heimdallarchaeota archaeon LC_2]